MASPHTTLSLPKGPLWMVDDEAELVQGTVAMLGRELGSEHVRGSTDPREVASWIERERPAALITDIRMPHVNGLELVTRLHEKWGPVPVVVMTAYPTAQVSEQANAGRFAYLPKPFTFRSLRETLARVCAQPAPSAFSGAIAVSMLDEVVQLYGLAQRSGRLRVLSGEGAGDIDFDSGRVVHAQTGALRGIDAFNQILSWSSGSFSWTAEPPEEATIDLGLSELLLDAYRLRDERAAGIDPGSTNDADDELLLDAWQDSAQPGGRARGDNVEHNLTKLERSDGFLGAAVFDAESGVCVASLDKSPTLHISDSVGGHAELVRAERRTIAQLKLEDALEDIIISLQREYHLLRPCRRRPSLCLFLVLERSKANLAMARHLLSDVERDMVL